MSQDVTSDTVPYEDEARHYKSFNKNLATEPMAESSDSCDSFESNRVRTQKTVQNQIVIQNPTGVVHLGPVYNLNIGQAFTQVNSKQQHTVHQTTGAEFSTLMDNEREERLDIPAKEDMRILWYSKRVLELEELPRLSQNIGANWKAVGNGLKFNWAQLDQFEADTKTMGEAVQRMLFRWLQWKDQKATVGRLTKVLFNHKEYDAIRCLKP